MHLSTNGHLCIKPLSGSGCDDSMVSVVFFCGLGNVLLETYKEEALEERRMKMKRIRDFFKFDATL